MRCLILLLLMITPFLHAADPCRLSPEAQADLRRWQENIGRLSVTENRQSLDALLARYPDEYEIQVRRISFYTYTSILRDEWPATRAAMVKRAEANSQDPLALTLAGAALFRHDTPRAIRLLLKARAIAPEFPWSAFKLAETLGAGVSYPPAPGSPGFAEAGGPGCRTPAGVEARQACSGGDTRRHEAERRFQGGPRGLRGTCT